MTFSQISPLPSEESTSESVWIAQEYQAQPQISRLFHMALDAMLIADDQGHYLEANPAACALLGLPREQLLGLTIADFAEPGLDWRATWQQFLEAGQGRGEFTLICRDGERREVEYAATANFHPHQHLSILRDITERKRAETQCQVLTQQLEERVAERTQELVAAEADLKKQQQWLDSILSSIQGVVWSVNPITSEVAYVNAAVAQIYGYPAETFLADPSFWFGLVHPEDQARVAAEISVRPHPQRMCLEYRLVRSDGQVRWLREQSNLVNDAAGNPLRIDGITTDITDIKQMEADLRLNEARTRAVFQQAAIGINQSTLDGRFIQVNQTFCKMLGYSEAELLQLRYQDITHPEDGPETHTDLQKLYQGQIDSVAIEKRYIRKDGTPLWTSMVLSILRDESGQPIADIAMVQDISDRKAAELALQQSEATKRAMLEAIPDLLLRINRQGIRLDFMSGGEIKLFPTVQWGQQQSIYETLPKPIADQRMYFIQQALDTGERQRYEHTIDVDGDFCHEETRIVPLNQDEVLVMVRDVTDRVVAENARKQIEQELERTKAFLEQTNTLARVGGWELDLLQHDVSWSQMTREIHEVEADFVPTLETGLNFYREGDHRNQIEAAVERAIHQGKSWDLKLQIVTAKGNVRWVRTIGRPDWDGETCTRICGAFQDIDAQMHSEMALQTLTEQLQQAQGMAQMGNWWFDLAREELYWSQEVFRIFGLSPDQTPVLLKDHPELIHPDEIGRAHV